MFEFYIERYLPILDGIGLVWVGKWVVWGVSGGIGLYFG